MAWRAQEKSNELLVARLQQYKIIRSKEVASAMAKVDRAEFCQSDPYYDCPQPIGYGATISAPHMHAEALERLKDYLKPGMKALDVGSGSGYLCTCMAYMVGSEGKVIGIDHIKELVDFSLANVAKNHQALLDEKRLEIVHGDGRKGYEAGAPYDCIHVGAAAPPEVPPILCKQLKPGGMLVTPVAEKGGEWFRSYEKSKDGKTIEMHNLMPVRYVPLTDASKQIKGSLW